MRYTKTKRTILKGKIDIIKLIDFSNFSLFFDVGIAVIVLIIRVMDTVMVVEAAEAVAVAPVSGAATVLVVVAVAVAIDSAAAKINQANVCVAYDGMNSN